MKNIFLFLVLPTLALAQAPGSGDGPQPTFPQVPPPAAADKGGPMREKMRDKFRERMMEELPPELRKRFEAAREKVMQAPAIQALKNKADVANDELRKAMREAMMKADPELAEMLKGFAAKTKGRGEGGGLGNLSEGERQKLMSARSKAKDDPAVEAASAKRKNAKTPEERAAADKEFHDAMRTALLKADPSLGPILDQIKPDGPRRQRPPKGRDPAGPSMPPTT